MATGDSSTKPESSPAPTDAQRTSGRVMGISRGGKARGQGAPPVVGDPPPELSLPLRPRRCIGEFRHRITNQKIRSSVYLIDFPEAMNFRLPNRRWRWLSPASLKEFPVSSMTFKAAKILASHEKNSS